MGSCTCCWNKKSGRPSGLHLRFEFGGKRMIDCWRIHSWFRVHEPERSQCPHCWRALWKNFVRAVRISSNYLGQMNMQYHGVVNAIQRTILRTRGSRYSRSWHLYPRNTIHSLNGVEDIFTGCLFWDAISEKYLRLSPSVEEAWRWREDKSAYVRDRRSPHSLHRGVYGEYDFKLSDSAVELCLYTD